jgi:putative addiction module killer protein
MYEIVLYQNKNGKEPLTVWLNGLEKKTRSRIRARILTIQSENLGDYKRVGQGVCELRFFFDGGIRIYFGRDGEKIIVLLCGGDKSTQKRDIETAKKYWKDYKNG